jgi:hypothetical protein
MDKVHEIAMALREITGLSGAKQRERYLMSRMEWLLEQSRYVYRPDYKCWIETGNNKIFNGA